MEPEWQQSRYGVSLHAADPGLTPGIAYVPQRPQDVTPNISARNNPMITARYDPKTKNVLLLFEMETIEYCTQHGIFL